VTRTLCQVVFVALNTALRHHRRRLATLAVVLGLAGAVVTAHSVMAGDHMGDGVAMCLAVANTAVIAAGAALVLGVATSRRRRWLIAAPAFPVFAYTPAPRSVPARAGPPLLQVFRL
jgi:drug/metabolite transporter (DMT)-like permease